MGWANFTLPDGREAGYAVTATCDEHDCDEEIDRGLAFVCGGMHEGGEHGCGKYFCYNHLYMPGQLCAICFDAQAQREESEIGTDTR